MGVDVSKSTPSDPGGSGILDRIVGDSANLGAGLASGLTGIIGGIGQALSGGLTEGIFAPISDGMKPIRDAQLDLNHRTDLLEGVQGYAHAYMSKNINAQWNFGDNWRFLPFDAQLGPSLGASVRGDGRIEMGSQGLWLVTARVHARATAFGGNNDVTMRVRVFQPNGGFHSDVYVRGASARYTGLIHVNEKGPVSLTVTFPVVVPGPGYYVRVDAWADAWRWWDGGSQLSGLSVLKQSDNVENPGELTVPDETESEAGA